MSGSNVTDPVSRGFAITPNDSTDTTHACRALYVGVSGDVRVTLFNGEVVTFTALPVGFQPIAFKRVHATGTTATSLLGFYN